MCVVCVSYCRLRRRRHQKKNNHSSSWCRRHLGAIENDTPPRARFGERGPSPHQLKKEEKRRRRSVCVVGRARAKTHVIETFVVQSRVGKRKRKGRWHPDRVSRTISVDGRDKYASSSRSVAASCPPKRQRPVALSHEHDS